MLSSLYTGASGMKTHSEGMSILGNNLANVNTVAYKTRAFTFASVMDSEEVSAENNVDVGISQVGHGVMVNDIKPVFTQGGFETTNTSTDLAIGGNGFFRVMNGDNAYYTRAGNFRFDQSGYLVDPTGYNLQGRAISDEGVVSSVSSDVQLNLNSTGQVVMNPNSTSQVSIYSNLGSGNNVNDATNPYFSMASIYDGTSSTPLASSEYAHSHSMQVYSEDGSTHSVTVYFDEVGTDAATGQRDWEYMVATDPTDDGSSLQNSSNAGMLMLGTLSFDNSGNLIGQSAFTGGTGKDLSTWTQASFGADGYPQTTGTFADGDSVTFGLDLGLTNQGTTWISGAANAGAVGTDRTQLPSFDYTRNARATTNHGGTSATSYQNQNGYPEGVMTGLSFGNDGIMEGTFSNGESQSLYQLTLYNFINPQGLRAEGHNHFSETIESGAVTEGVPQEGGLGSITDYALEQSNVDMAYEFVNMITMQRGFQSNGKVITTSDTLLQTALNMKR